MKRFECRRAIAPLIKDEFFVTTAGGEPTVATAGRIDFAAVARNAGIKSARAVTTVEELREVVGYVLENDGSHFICANIEPRRAEAPPLKYDELENKYRFIRYIEQTEGVDILRVPTSASYLLK
jgi:hypothetical protein